MTMICASHFLKCSNNLQPTPLRHLPNESSKESLTSTSSTPFSLTDTRSVVGVWAAFISLDMMELVRR